MLEESGGGSSKTLQRLVARRKTLLRKKDVHVRKRSHRDLLRSLVPDDDSDDDAEEVVDGTNAQEARKPAAVAPVAN
jgi:hypothetical protein